MARLPDSVVDAARNSDVLAVAESYGIEFQKQGKDYFACCPFHGEKTPSFTVNTKKNLFHCFGCGTNGSDAIALVMALENVSFRDAVLKITGHIESGSLPERSLPEPDEADDWQPVFPAPENKTPPDTIWRKIDGQMTQITGVARWPYRDIDGSLRAYDVRFVLPNGKKQVITQAWCMNQKTGEAQWKWKGQPVPRTLYGLELLARYPAAMVLVVEGCKTANAARNLLVSLGVPASAMVVVSWPNGTQSIDKADWSPLMGRKVLLWPDADQKDYPDTHKLAGQRMPYLEQAGMAAMLWLADHLEPGGGHVRIAEPPDDVPDGWDLADDLPEDFELKTHVKHYSISAADLRARYAVVEPEPEQTMPPEVEPAPMGGEYISADDAAEHDDLLKNPHFAILGYDQGEYYFFVHEKRQVMSLRKGDFTDIGLIELAPINWWESMFPATNGGTDRKSAANWIFRTANARGVYDPDRVRGRGAWSDKGRIVFHHGYRLSVDGQHVELTQINSGYVYQAARPMPEPADAMSDEEGRELLNVSKMVRWSMPASAALLAGWVMLAPICGALKWRPHIWITGAAGSGKSTIQKAFCAGLLRGVGVYVMGTGSTEPGIRQHLRSDSLPVMIDEIESNNEKDKVKVEDIVGLIRQTSTENQAQILKGGANNHGDSFKIRSMFCLCSINVNLPTKADVDRLTKLAVRPPAKNDRGNWEQLEPLLTRLEEDDDVSRRLLGRAINNAPVILENISVFRAVAARFFGTQRDGDQFGTLLAGAWSLVSSAVATPEQADAMIKSYDWSEHTEDHDLDDAEVALSSIMGAKLRVGGGQPEQTVHALIRDVHPVYCKGMVAPDVAHEVLKSNGIRVDLNADVIYLGTAVPNFKALVEGCSFATDVRGQLLRIPGVTNHGNQTVSFNGRKSKVLALPVGLVLGEE